MLTITFSLFEKIMLSRLQYHSDPHKFGHLKVSFENPDHCLQFVVLCQVQASHNATKFRMRGILSTSVNLESWQSRIFYWSHCSCNILLFAFITQRDSSGLSWKHWTKTRLLTPASWASASASSIKIVLKSVFQKRAIPWHNLCIVLGTSKNI